jgi:hypothetical protein
MKVFRGEFGQSVEIKSAGVPKGKPFNNLEH